LEERHCVPMFPVSVTAGLLVAAAPFVGVISISSDSAKGPHANVDIPLTSSEPVTKSYVMQPGLIPVLRCRELLPSN
jgi:hypothetical protein